MNDTCFRLALALVVLFGFCAIASAQNVYTVEQMERWVFQQDGNASSARQRLDAHLTIHVDEIERACKLTDVQKAKLLLAGRGDIKHFFDRYETVRRTFKPINQNAPDFQEVWQKFWQSISPLQMSLQTGLFEADSLFDKSLATTFTTEQRSHFDALLDERRHFQFRCAIDQTVQQIDQAARLTGAQRRQLTEFFTKEIKPPRRASNYDTYYLLWQLSRLPDSRLEGLFDKAQRKAIDGQLNQARSVAQSLRGQKLWPGDEQDEKEEKPASTPAGVFKK
jgi:hypothetical protein